MPLEFASTPFRLSPVNTYYRHKSTQGDKPHLEKRTEIVTHGIDVPKTQTLHNLRDTGYSTKNVKDRL